MVLELSDKVRKLEPELEQKHYSTLFALFDYLIDSLRTFKLEKENRSVENEALK